jgi:hypothetical protein
MDARKQVGTAVLISDKADFKPRSVRRQTRSPHVEEGSNSSSNVTIINIYAPNVGARCLKSNSTGHENTDPQRRNSG